MCQLEKDKNEGFCPTNVMIESDSSDDEEQWAPEGPNVRNVFDELFAAAVPIRKASTASYAVGQL